MRTAAEHVTDRLVGVVVTGMGKDGADGATAISAAGGTVIAQDAASAVVHGMPGAAIETGCVDTVAPASDLAARTLDAVSEREVHP
jgi:two-component system chemotaxis response regulator CheB